MAELVAECAHAINARAGVRAALQLIENGKLVDGHAIELERSCGTVAPIIALLHIPLAGPHRLGHGAPGLRLAHTGKQYDHHIDEAIAVIVIVREIHLGNTHTRLIDHRTQLGVIATHVSTIESAVIGKFNGAQNLKLGRELAARLCFKVMQATIFHLVKLILKCRYRICVDEFHIGVIYKDNGDARRPYCWHLRMVVALLAAGGVAHRDINSHLVAISGDEGGLLDVALPLVMGTHVAQHAISGVAVISVLVHRHRQAVERHQGMVEFATLHHQGHCRAVALPVGKGNRFRGYSHGCRAAHHGRDNRQDYCFHLQVVIIGLPARPRGSVSYLLSSSCRW